MLQGLLGNLAPQALAVSGRGPGPQHGGQDKAAKQADRIAEELNQGNFHGESPIHRRGASRGGCKGGF